MTKATSKITASDKKAYKEEFKRALQRRDLFRLFPLLIGAAAYGLSDSLISKGWLVIGEERAKQKEYLGAILAFNTARIKRLYDKKVVEKLFQSFNAFYEQLRRKFSREDLVLFKETIERLVHFYKIKAKTYPKLADIAAFGDDLLHRITKHVETAPLKDKTQATSKVKQISAALYSEMTPEELRTEFAKIVTPLIRKEYTKLTEASGGSGKKGGGKDKDEEPKDEEGKPENKSKNNPKQ
jgi:hypothetical protein